MKNILIVSCTQQPDQEVTLLHQSLKVLNCKDIEYRFHCNNDVGLSQMYNMHLTKKYAENYDIIAFVHDDVWIDDALIHRKLYEATLHYKYDIIGLAGTLNPEIKHPALWHIMGKKHDYRGYAGHYASHNQKFMTSFGPTPDRVAIVDGLFVAVNLKRALETGWRWNENFDFHHYDIASCLDANKCKMRVGVYPINVFHKSPGLMSLDDEKWSKSNQKFLQLYS